MNSRDAFGSSSEAPEPDRNHLCYEAVASLQLRSDSTPRPEVLRIPIESPLTIEINGTAVAHLMRLPGHDAELALGYCFTERFIGGIDDVGTLEVCGETEGLVRVTTPAPFAARPVSMLSLIHI